jgi:hypothetical protein
MLIARNFFDSHPIGIHECDLPGTRTAPDAPTRARDAELGTRHPVLATPYWDSGYSVLRTPYWVLGASRTARRNAIPSPDLCFPRLCLGTHCRSGSAARARHFPRGSSIHAHRAHFFRYRHTRIHECDHPAHSDGTRSYPYPICRTRHSVLGTPHWLLRTGYWALGTLASPPPPRFTTLVPPTSTSTVPHPPFSPSRHSTANPNPPRSGNKIHEFPKKFPDPALISRFVRKNRSSTAGRDLVRSVWSRASKTVDHR